MLLSLRKQAGDDYLHWFRTDKRMGKRIHELTKDIQRAPFDGTEKPEALKANYRGFWSRRIDKEHRMIYAATGDALIIVQLRHRY